MKILVYSHDWAPTIGGIQTVTMTLAQGLGILADSTAGGTQAVTVVTHTAAGEMDDASLPFPVVRRPSVLRLARLIRTQDVVHVAGPALVPLFLAWVLRKKIVVQHHGYQAVCPDGGLLRCPDRNPCPNEFLGGHPERCVRCHAGSVGWVRSLLQVLLAYPRLWLCRRAAENVAVSDHIRRRLDLPAATTIYNGTRCDTRPHGPTDSRAPLPPYVVFIGRLVPEKGVGVLIGAAMELAAKGCEFRVRIIGDGPQRITLEALVRALELGDFISFTGYLEGDELAQATNGAIATVMPSVCEEAAGLAAIEQMMRGKMIIASDIGGLSEVIGSAGLKFEPGDSHGLAECIQCALEDAELRIRLGATARERALALFTDKRMVAEHVAIYERVLVGQVQAKWRARLIRRLGVPVRHTRAS